uniref:Reverse transcriptase domain-containing protein n=1 Tax=Podarcis muralis TaxID=64176 RepID=A0A670IVF8_PODMU
MSWNVAGLSSKLADSDFINFLESYDIILLQETWSLKPLNIPNFITYNLPATKMSTKGRPKAGLICGIKQSSNFKINYIRNIGQYAQLLSFSIGYREILLLNIYFPPIEVEIGPDYGWNIVSEELYLIRSKSPNIPLIIMGDTNARIGSDNTALYKRYISNLAEDAPLPLRIGRNSKDIIINKAGGKLLQLVLEFNLSFLNGSMWPDIPGNFTFSSKRGRSVIDYSLVSIEMLNEVASFTVVPRSESDHFPIVLKMHRNPRKYDICPMIGMDKTIYAKRIYISDKNREDLLAVFEINPAIPESVANQNLMPVEDNDCYYKTIQELFSSFLNPQFSNKPLNKYNWFDKDCINYKKELRTCLKEAYITNSQGLWKTYFEMKNAFKNMLLEKKSEFALAKWSKIVTALEIKDTKTFWSLLSLKDITDLPNISEEAWISHFTAVFYDYQVCKKENFKFSLAKTTQFQITVEEMKKIIISFKQGKSPGMDGIPIDLLRLDVEWWAIKLVPLFNSIYQSALVPKSWNNSIVVPIFKKGDRNCPENYRPISLLPCISKIYAKSLLIKLEEWMLTKGLPGKEQAGFKAGSSTLDQCLVLSHLVDKYVMRNRRKLFVAFVDLKSAFDSVDRNKLWTKLEHLDIDPYLLTLIQSLHSNNQIYVKVSKDGRLAGPILNNRGVRQGCILAPTLFNLFLSDLPLFLQNATTHTPYLNNSPLFLLLYADDAVIISLSVLGLKKYLRVSQTTALSIILKLIMIRQRLCNSEREGTQKAI